VNAPVSAPTLTPHAGSRTDRAHVLHAVRRTIGLLLAALLAYAVWRGYHHPDLLLDLAAFRLC
jgi:hypothetical protein